MEILIIQFPDHVYISIKKNDPYDYFAVSGKVTFKSNAL